MTVQIEAQQFSIASYVADSIENQVKLRINALTTIADRITPELIANHGKLREFLRDKPLLLTMFQTGFVVISREGAGIADYPVLPGRAGGSVLDREYFKEVVASGKPAVGKPAIGRFSRKPVIGFAVPILDRSGRLMGVLAGFTLLSDPTLLGTLESSPYKNFSDRLLVGSRKYHMYITGSDPTRLLEPRPALGFNPLVDRIEAGFEGSGITVNSRGVRILVSGKQIPTPGWFIRVGLPTEMAFAPIRSMKRWAYSVALGLSFLSSLLVWLVIRQAMRPLYAASSLIKDITEERLPPQDIPVTRYDEVGQLITSFNVHLNFRKQVEESQRLERDALKRILNNMPDGIYIVNQQYDIEYINPVIEREFGNIKGRKCYQYFHDRTEVCPWCKNPEVFAGESVRWEWNYFKTGRTYDLFDTPLINTDGSISKLQMSHDITERKNAEEALRVSEAKFKAMVETLPLAIYLNAGIEQIGEYLNPMFIKLFGYTLEEIPSASQWWPLAYPDETYRRQISVEWTTRVTRAIETQTPIEPMEVVVTCKDGSKKNILWGYITMGDTNYAYGLDLSELKKAEGLLKQSLKEKEALLREIHHRVKNNMAVVSGLLSLQAKTIEDVKVRSIFEESQQRVRSMALVHEKLYQTKDLSSVNFEDYIKSIISEIIGLYRIDTGVITMEINVEDIELDLEAAVPCGLIINELLTNALKYAFPDNRSGVLSVHFTKTEDTYTLSIKDNGVGLPEGFDYKEASTLGLRLVKVLTGQLRGAFEIKSDKGTEAVVTFKTKRN
ncbi:MAG: PAS domain-containing protein [Nitrospirae bacterium]|nr:PAS domain-containing protein [Nitrospirota bacterium]